MTAEKKPHYDGDHVFGVYFKEGLIYREDEDIMSSNWTVMFKYCPDCGDKL